MKELSNFFKNRNCTFSEYLYCDSKNKKMSLDEYSKYKNVKIFKNTDSDRSICQMLRNVNGMTDYKYHKNIVILVNFANNAVINLGLHSKEPGNRWGGKKTRSHFTEEKKLEGIEILNNPYHSVFVELKKIYDLINDNSILDYIVEIAYYMERINSKILEYETKNKNSNG